MPAAKLKAVLVSEIVWEILWTKEMRARRGNEAIELTATEFALLAAMTCQSGCVFTRSQLFDVIRRPRRQSRPWPASVLPTPGRRGSRS